MSSTVPYNELRVNCVNMIELICGNLNHFISEKDWPSIQNSFGQLNAYLNVLKDIDDMCKENDNGTKL